MMTGQKYGEGDSLANNLEQMAQNPELTEIIKAVVSQKGAVLVPKSYTEGKYLLPHTLEQNAFVDSCFDLEYVNRMREAIRSWFCCYMPEDVSTHVHGPGVDRSIVLFQDMDEFLGDLMVASYRETELNNLKLMDEMREMVTKFENLVKRTNGLEDKADKIEAKLNGGTTRSDN